VPIEDLLAAVEAAARAEVVAVREAGRRVAARFATEGEARRGRRRAEATAAREAAFRADLAAALSETRRQVSESLWRARERLVARALDAVRARLGEAAQREAYRRTLASRVEDALACVDEGAVSVRCSPSLLPALRDLPATARVRIAPDEAIAVGFVVTAADGSVAVDERLSAHLERARGALAVELLRLVGEEDFWRSSGTT
jgi:vacuolar-type H+-ATPase subunit E/Vma4